MTCSRKPTSTRVTCCLLHRRRTELDSAALNDFTADAALSALSECLGQFAAAQRLVAHGQVDSGLLAIGRGQQAAAAALDSLRYLMGKE
jgi:hypothetical protein